MYLSTLANNRRLTSRFIHERTNQSAAHHTAELRILPVAYPRGVRTEDHLGGSSRQTSVNRACENNAALLPREKISPMQS